MRLSNGVPTMSSCVERHRGHWWFSLAGWVSRLSRTVALRASDAVPRTLNEGPRSHLMHIVASLAICGLSACASQRPAIEFPGPVEGPITPFDIGDVRRLGIVFEVTADGNIQVSETYELRRTSALATNPIRRLATDRVAPDGSSLRASIVDATSTVDGVPVSATVIGGNSIGIALPPGRVGASTEIGIEYVLAGATDLLGQAPFARIQVGTGLPQVENLEIQVTGLMSIDPCIRRSGCRLAMSAPIDASKPGHEFSEADALSWRNPDNYTGAIGALKRKTLLVSNPEQTFQVQMSGPPGAFVPTRAAVRGPTQVTAIWSSNNLIAAARSLTTLAIAVLLAATRRHHGPTRSRLPGLNSSVGLKADHELSTLVASGPTN